MPENPQNGRARSRKNGGFDRAKAAEIAGYLCRATALCAVARLSLSFLAEGLTLCLCGGDKSIL